MPNNKAGTAVVVKFIGARPQRPTIDDYAADLQAQGRMTPAVREAIDKARAVRADHDIVFYVAGALTGMSDKVKQRYVDLSDLVATYNKPGAKMFGYAPHLHGTDPVKHPDVTPDEVRDIDYLWSAVVPDGHFNFWDPVAHGNAAEAAWAEQHGIPAVYLVPEGLVPSRLVRGMHNILTTLVYVDFWADGLPQIQEFLNELEAEQISAPASR